MFMNSNDLEELRRIFNAADTDSSGTISAQELATSMSTVQSLCHLEQEQINKIFTGVDTDGSGEIEFIEFCQAALDYQCLL